MQIISLCTKIVSALSICASHSPSLFTEFDSFGHFCYLMALITPVTSLCTGFPPLFSKPPLIFVLITFAPNDPFHSAAGVRDALHRLRGCLCLCQGSSLCYSCPLLLVLPSSTGTKLINGNTLYMQSSYRGAACENSLDECGQSASI